MKFKKSLLERWRIEYVDYVEEMSLIVETDSEKALELGVKIDETNKKIINMIEETSGGTISPPGAK